MKKFFSIMLAALLTVTSLGTVSLTSAAEEAEVASTGFVSQVTELGSKIPNTYAKMLKGENINLGYFGGSVTNGYAPANAYNNASNQGVDCWRGRSKVWLQETYGTKYGITIAETNSNGKIGHAGLGGTGIDLNLYRADRYLGLSSGDPVDLVFIEFSINDSYEGNSYEKSAYFMESCIKMIREKSPTTDIIIMLTTDHTKLSDTNRHHMNAQAHVDVAEYYGIPYFWFGDYMYEFFLDENEKLGNGRVLPSSGSQLWQTYMADGCHPSPQGYKKYFEFLRDNFLIPNLDDTKGYSTEVVNYTCPEVPYNQTQLFLTNLAKYSTNSSVYYGQRLRTDAYMVSPSEMVNIGTEGYGYKLTNPGGWSNFYSSNPGMSFSVKFKSRNAGIYYKGHPTMGLIQYRVDGGDWQYKSMYTSGQNQNEYFMFYENLEDKEHTVDVILRKTANGVDLEFRGLFIEGDSAKAGAVLLQGAPNNVPLNDIVSTPIVLTPSLLNTKISGNGTTNSGSDFSVYHLGVTDTDVLRYIPNPSSSDTVASDCYNSTLKSINISKYKYAVIKYYYELEPGTTEYNAEGNRQLLVLVQKDGSTKKSTYITAADKIVLGGTSAHKSLVDLNAVAQRSGLATSLDQMHFYPYGNVKGNQLVSTELMNVESITFYAEYPFNEEYEITVPVNKTINATAQTIDLSDVRVLPSTHQFATVKYSADEETTLTFKFANLYNLATNATDKTFTITKKLPAGDGEVIVSLAEIAESGQAYYYSNFSLSADNSVAIESIEFDINYPNPDEQFKIEFDANGGTGAVPNPIYGKYGDKIALPEASMENGSDIFLGWSKTPDGSQIVSEIFVPVDGMTLYATYAKAGVLTYDLNGGSGSIPSKVKIAVGRESSLMSADITKGNSVFLGWGTSPTATTTIDKITMTESGVTVYAIFKELSTVYVAADGSVNYNGVEHTADYADIAAAFAALGTSGGHIIFEGIFPGTENVGVKGAPLYILEGADGNAGLTFTGYTVNFQCNLKLKNLAFLRYSQDPYFYANGYKIVFDEGFGFYGYNEDAANKRGSETGLKGGLRGGKAIMNDGMLASYFTGGNYNANSSGNTYMEFNANSNTYGFTMGSYFFDQYDANSFTHTGNATVVINGGTFSSKNIKVDHNSKFPTTVTGATSVILNNGISGFSFDSKIKYVISSTAGGKVSLAADGTSSYAPTFFIKANNPEALIYIDGVEVPAENGEYLFMPKSTGKYSVTYKAGTKAYLNTTGSGKLTVGGVEHDAYTTLADALASIDSTGGTIYFDGDVSVFDMVTESSKGYTDLVFIGTSDNSVAVFDKSSQPGAFGCNITIKNCHFRNDQASNWPYLRSGKYTVTIGGLDDTVNMTVTKKNSSGGYDAASLETIVTANGGKYVINAGSVSKLGQNYSGAATQDVVYEVNGGTISADGLRPFYGNHNNAASILTGNYVVTINGGTIRGTISGTNINCRNNSNIQYNAILIFNNGLKNAQSYSISNVDYIVDAPEGIKVEAVSYGNATTAPTFKLTPAEGIEKVFVNQAEVVAVDGAYTYKPTAKGTLVVEADLVLPAVTFDKGDATSGTVPGPVTANVGATVTLPSSDLAKDGFIFAGWATAAGKTKPDYTSTLVMPEGGITLYPAWRIADVIFVSSKGTITYGGVEYAADYTDLVTAVKEKGATFKKFVFEGAYPIGDVFTNTTAGTSITFEGLGTTSILYASGSSAVNAYVRADMITLSNVAILKKIYKVEEKADGSLTKSYADFYIQGANHGITFNNGTTTYIEADKDTNIVGSETAGIKSYELSKFYFHSGKAAGQMHMGPYGSLTTTGNKYLEIDGTAIPDSSIQLGGLAWGDKAFTHNGNITVVINGGNLATSHAIKVDQQAGRTTTVNGAVSAIINNGLADTTAFSFDKKIQYIIKSAKGGMVSLATEGSATTAPTFLITTSERNSILINGEKVSDTGSYSYKPTEAGTAIVTYEAKPVEEKVTFDVTFADKATNGSAIVDDETGFDGRAVLEIEGMDPIYLEDAGNDNNEASADAVFGEGTFNFSVRKNGYISFKGTIVVDNEGNVTMPEIPELIAGDIKSDFNATEGDGEIGVDDFIRVLRGFNTTESNNNALLKQIVDINEDGTVTVADLAVIKANYGKSADSYAE